MNRSVDEEISRDIAIETLQDECNRLREECRRLQRENEMLRLAPNPYPQLREVGNAEEG